MKKALSIIMALVLAMTSFAVMSFAADEPSIIEDKILLKTGDTESSAATFAMGERVYGSLTGDATACYKLKVEDKKEISFSFETSADLKVTIKRNGSLEEYSFEVSGKKVSGENAKKYTLDSAYYFITIELVTPFITTDADAGELRALSPATAEYRFEALCDGIESEVWARINKNSAELIAGSSLQLMISDCTVDNLNCFWRVCEDPDTEIKETDVATVSDDGLVTITMNKGTFTKETAIKVQAVMYYGSDVEATLTCTIKATPANIYLDPVEAATKDYVLNLGIGGRKTITATTNVEDMDIVWSSTNPEIATVTDFGKITGVSEGTTTIKATIGTSKVSRSIKVIVDGDYVAVTGVDFNEATGTVKTNESITLGYTFQTSPSTNPNPTNKNVTFTSSNPEIATVDADGNVTGVAEGEVTITITTADGNFTDECKITVTPGIPNWLMVILAPLRIIYNFILLIIGG